MKISGLIFHHLYINVMNVSESVEHMMKRQGNTILAFIPIQYYRVHKGNYRKDNRVARLSKLNIPHEIAEVLKCLAQMAVRGIRYKCNEKNAPTTSSHLLLELRHP